MSAATSAVQIKAVLDHVAKGRQTQKSAFVGGTSCWDNIDAAQDQPFENRVKGQDITDLDTALADASFWNTPKLRKLFDLFNQYYVFDLGLTSSYFQSFLDTVGWRVSYEAAMSYYEASGLALTGEYVFPKGTRPADTVDPSTAGMHKIGYWTGTTTDTFTAVDGALPTNVFGAVVVISREITPGGSSPKLTATLQDGVTTKDIQFSPSASEFGQILLGSQAIGAAAAASGQLVVPVAATAQFAASEWVLLVKADYSVIEKAQIDSLVLNTSLTMKSNLINSFAENDLVLPMFTDVTRKSGSITSGKHLDIYGWPDRIIAL